MYNYLFRFEPADYFCSKVITVQRQVQEPHNIKMELFATTEQLKAVNYYREVPHLSNGRVHGSVSDN